VHRWFTNKVVALSAGKSASPGAARPARCDKAGANFAEAEPIPAESMPEGFFNFVGKTLRGKPLRR
jgi:hypothetical protein